MGGNDAHARRRNVRFWHAFVWLLVGVLPFAHVVANYLAWRHAMLNYSFEPGAQDWIRDLGSGAVGGFAGGVLALVLLVPLRLTPLTAASRAILLFGIAVLTVIGALGMAQGLLLTNALEYELKSSRFVFWFECVHVPWQACLAFFLAGLMRLGRRPSG